MQFKTEHVIIGAAALGLWYMNKKKKDSAAQTAKSGPQYGNLLGSLSSVDLNVPVPNWNLSYKVGEESAPDSDAIIVQSIINGDLQQRLIDEYKSFRDQHFGRASERNKFRAASARVMAFFLLGGKLYCYFADRMIPNIYVEGHGVNMNREDVLSSGASQSGVDLSRTVFLVNQLSASRSGTGSTSSFDSIFDDSNVIDLGSRFNNRDGVCVYASIVTVTNGTLDIQYVPDLIDNGGGTVGIDSMKFGVAKIGTATYGGKTLNVNGLKVQLYGANQSLATTSFARLFGLEALDTAVGGGARLLAAPAVATRFFLPDERPVVPQRAESVDECDTSNAISGSSLWKTGGDPTVDPYYSLTRYMATHNLFDPNVTAPASVANIVKAGINRIYDLDNQTLSYAVAGGLDAEIKHHSQFKLGGE